MLNSLPRSNIRQSISPSTTSCTNMKNTNNYDLSRTTISNIQRCNFRRVKQKVYIQLHSDHITLRSRFLTPIVTAGLSVNQNVTKTLRFRFTLHFILLHFTFYRYVFTLYRYIYKHMILKCSFRDGGLHRFPLYGPCMYGCTNVHMVSVSKFKLWPISSGRQIERTGQYQRLLLISGLVLRQGPWQFTCTQDL